MKFQQIETLLNRVINRMNNIQKGLQEIGYEASESVSNVTLELNKYDRKAYVDITQAFNFVVDQYNDLITRHFFVNEYGETAQFIKQFKLHGLVIGDVEKLMYKKLDELNAALAVVISGAKILGVDLGKELYPFPDIIQNTGYQRVANFPDRSWSSSQGAGFDDEYYYAFGGVNGAGGKLLLAVTHKADPNKSFVARGELGTFIRGDEVTDKTLYENMLGHANDCTVLEKKNGIVKLLVTSMLPTEMATCFVDLNKQTNSVAG